MIAPSGRRIALQSVCDDTPDVGPSVKMSHITGETPWKDPWPPLRLIVPALGTRISTVDRARSWSPHSSARQLQIEFTTSGGAPKKPSYTN